MTGIREVLAANLKENRRKLGLTQERLAEEADVSTHYIAMIETCNKYPKPEMLERLAKALGIEPCQLFSVSAAPEEALERLRQSIIADVKQVMADMRQVVRETIQETLAGKCKDKDRV
ncbi:MAG: helix-turn-helix domain-containing protein [Spirochaetaceae bacterium]|jgi:transcriptional regulator with XRE-family HTH domain|nr:helix-turn-helix domain-containing protein [Spirochaetaceae bacterium]